VPDVERTGKRQAGKVIKNNNGKGQQKTSFKSQGIFLAFFLNSFNQSSKFPSLYS
jgi:hypothetical protein